MSVNQDPEGAFRDFCVLVAEEPELFERLCQAGEYEEMAKLACALGRERGFAFGLGEVRGARRQAAKLFREGDRL